LPGVIVARRITAPVAWRPGTALSRDLLAVGYDEAGGQRRSLGSLLQDPRDVWWALCADFDVPRDQW
jgi:hypothetical protein